jgi:hypothetical protein
VTIGNRDNHNGRRKMIKAAVPAVDPEDLEKAYELVRTTPPDHAIGDAVFTATCKPGVDLEPIGRRLRFLYWLAQSPNKGLRMRLLPWRRPEGVWTAPAFRVASRFPMDWYSDSTLPSIEELEEFIQQLKNEGF